MEKLVWHPAPFQSSKNLTTKRLLVVSIATQQKWTKNGTTSTRKSFSPQFLEVKIQTKQQESPCWFADWDFPKQESQSREMVVRGLPQFEKNMHKSKLQIFKHSSRVTLQGINISPTKALLKMSFLFPRWEMWVPERVKHQRFFFKKNQSPETYTSDTISSLRTKASFGFNPPVSRTTTEPRVSPSMGLGEKEQTQLCCSVMRSMM